MRKIRKTAKSVICSVLLVGMFFTGPGSALYADTLYHQNTGANTTLDTALFTPAAPGSIVQNYAEGTAFTAGDIIVFNNVITAATTFRVSNTTGTNLAVGGLTIGSFFNNTTLNPGGAITIQNFSNAAGGALTSQTITLGAGGIDMSRATQNLTISRDATVATNTLTLALSAPQTWSVNTGRTLTVSNDITTGGNALTIQGGVAGAGTVVLGSTTGAVTGGGALIINGMNTGAGNTVTLSGNNGAAGLGATTVGGGSTLNIDQSAASQNKLNDTLALTLNRATLNLQGTGGGTETVGNLVLGGTFNAITRSAGTGILGAGAITRSAGAVLNVGAAGIATTTNANVNGILGGWAVINQTDFATNAFAAVAATTTAETGWTAALNEVQTANPVLTASRDVNSLKFNGAGAQTFGLGGFTLNVTSGGLIRNQAFTTVISNGTLTAGGVADTVADELFLWNNQNTMTVSAVIADNGTDVVNLVKAGAASVTLSGNNTYTGTTTVAQGTLNFGDNAVGGNVATFGTGTTILNDGLIQFNKTSAASVAQRTISQNISGAGSINSLRGTTIFLSGTNTYYGDTTVTLGTLQADTAASFSPNSRMILNAAGVGAVVNPLVLTDVSVSALRGDQNTAFFTLSAGNLILSGVDPTSNGAAQNYQGIISGAGGIVKNGTYTQNFTGTGALSYTGTTTVNAGILQFNKASTTTGLTITGSGQVIANAANITAASANLSLTGEGSTLQVNGGFNQSVATLTGVANSRITLGAASNLLVTDAVGGTFAGVISGAGSFTKAGVGALVLTGGNAYTGATTINDGTIQIGAANAVQVINDRSAVVVGATGILDLNGNNETIGSLAGVAGGSVTFGAGNLTVGLNNTSTDYAGVTSGAGGLTKVGNGVLTLSGANSFTGAVNIGNVGGQTGGGLTIGVGGSLADTVNVRNSGWNTTFGVDATDTVGAVTGTRNTSLALGTGATLTSTYTNGTAVALAATADSASANGRIVRDVDTSQVKVGDLITGTGITAGSYVVQIIDNNTVLVNQNVPAGPLLNFAPTVTSVGVLNSAITGLGGFTKTGTGTLILTGNSTHSGATTINDGTVQIGGIWNGQKFSLHDTLSDSSSLVFAAVGTQTVNFANSSTNLTSFERIGSLAGGSATSTINLTSGANVAVLALGGDNTSTTYSGTFLPGNSGGWIIKEGTGNFTWSNGVTNVFDGPIIVENGTFTIAGAQGVDASNEIFMTNRGTTLAVTTTGGDAIPFLQGGKGDARTILGTGTQPVGGLTSNYLTTVAPIVTLTTNLTVNENTAPNLATLAGVYTFNGDIQGASTLIKSGNHLWRLMGTSSNLHTGETQITAGTLQMGVLSRGAGVGAISGSDISGTLSTATGLRLTGGVLDINSTAQTVNRINATSTGGTIQLVNGSLTLSNQNTQTTGTVLTGNLNSVLNLNSLVAAQTLSLTGNSTGFGGTINVGTNAALTLNRAGGALNSTGTAGARVNLNGTGTQITVTLADTIGSLAGTGDAVLTQALTLREARSGTSSATAFTGVTSGAGALILSNFGGLTVSGNLAHSGGTTLSSGSALNLNYGAGNNIIPTTGALTLNGGNVRVISTDATANILENAASTSLNAGASSVRALNSTTGYLDSGVDGLNLAAITRAAGGTIDFGRNAAATSTANVNGILGGWATFNGTTWAVANGGAAAITGLGAFSADVFGAGLHVDITAAGANAGGLADTLRFSGANAADITGATTIATGGILNLRSVGANTSTISGALNATGNELIIHQYNPLGDLILSNVAGTNTAITTAGGGRTQITNDIAGTGTTNIGNGYLQLGDSTVGGSAAGMVGSGLVFNNGTLAVNRSNAQTLGAIISGTGNLEQLGSGTTTLSVANTFTGRVTVRSGTLEVTNNAGLGAAATAPTNRWANLTSVNTGGTLLLNVAAGGALTEILNLDGGTLDLRSTVATTLGAPIVLTSDSTIHVSNPGAAVSHVISGEIFALPGADLAFTGVGGATPSTLILSPSATTGSRWGDTSVGAGAIVQVGTLAGSRGFIGTGNVSIAAGGTLAFSTNDNYVISNNITGLGTLALNRNANYLTGDLSGFGGTMLITPSAGQNINVVAELGNDTYGNSVGTGAITVTASAFAGNQGIASVRTHFNQDITMSNTINLNPATDGAATPNSKNAQFIRAGLGSVTLDGTINLGSTVAVNGSTQRNLIQTEGGGKLFLNATLTNNGNANNLLNIVNNNIIVIGGAASQNYNGVLSGNNVWVFNNSGTTTLSGANTVNSAHNYIRSGTVSLTGGAASNDDNDWQVLSGGTLNIAATETIGQLYMQRGAVTNVAAGQTLTVDDGAAQLIAGQLTGAGNLTLAGNNFMAMYPAVANTISGNLLINQGAIASTNLTAAIGSFTNITLGSAALNGGLEYTGAGETFAKNLTLAGTGSNYIAANGTGALVLSGNLTSTGATSTLRLIGQTGGYFNPITNRVDGIISDGANVLSLAMPNSGNDDRFGITSRWALTNSANDFSGGITVNVGMLEFRQLGTGADATSSMGDQTATRTITLGSDNFDGRRYDMFGSGDQIGAVGGGAQGTNTLAPTGNAGTIIFNDATAGTATFGANISWAQPSITAANTTAGQLINDGTKVVVINGTLTGGASGNKQWILDGTNTGTNTINGVISNPTTQTTSIIKEGAGTWRINNAANTFTGQVTVNNGILEIAGGGAVGNAATVALNADGGDGLFSGTAKVRFINSETIGLLSGDIDTEAEILAGQTLTITAGNSTMNGFISGGGNLTRTVSGGTGGTLTTTDKNTYTGITTLGSTGAATANAGISIWHIANGGVASGIGAGTAAATDLVFVTNTAGDRGGILTWNGYNNQSTDRLFTMGLGVAGARINAAGTVLGTDAPAVTFSNTGAIVMSGTGARTLTLGGTTFSDNTFRPAITNGGGPTTLAKVDAGLWVIDPAAAANTYTGGTSITGGTLAISAGDALGSGTITINGGAGTGLEIRGGAGITLANNFTNSTAEGGIGVRSGANILTGTYTTAVNTRFDIDSGASLEMSNATTMLSGVGQLIKLGNGTLILSGNSTATGNTFVRNGILELNYATNNTSKLFDGPTTGILTLGGITVHTTAGVDPNVAGVAKQSGQGGGTLHLNGGSHLEVVLSTTLEPGSNAITRGAGTSTIRLNAITRGVNQGTIDFGAAGIADTDTTNTNGILGTTTTGAFATVAKTDWAFNSTNAGDGAINALATYATDAYATGNNTNITVAAANTGAATLNNTFRFNANQATTLTIGAAFGVQGSAVGLQMGGILVTPNVGAFDTIINGAALQNAASTVNFETIVHQHNTAGALQIDSVIQNNTLATAQGLTKTGAGKLFLNANNTFSGFVNLFEGEIQVGGTAAAPTTPTNAFLSGSGLASGNNSTGWQLAEGTTLRFLTTNTSIYNTPAFNGEGKIIMDVGNLGVLLLDDDNGNWNGDLDFFGGTIRVGNQANALGGVRGHLNIANSVNFLYTAAPTNNKITNYAEGSTINFLNNTTTTTGTWSGEQRFNNTTTAGLNFNIPASATTNGVIGLNITGLIRGSNGFTKSGNGILQLSANNFDDVYDGYTGINDNPTLSGQILVNAGVLNVGGARALGAHGAGNEVIVASGASLDLRGQALNYGDDSDLTRKFLEISGTGATNAQGNLTGALRNTTGTGQTAFLKLNADSTINTGGQVNASAMIIGTFDSNLSNANALTGAFTRNAPVIDGGTRNLTIQGGRVGTDNFVIADPSFSSALGSLVIREGGSRLRHEVTANIGGAAGVAVTAANITGGIEIGYGGLTAADLLGAQVGGQGNTTSILGANVGARFLFENWFGTHHTVNLTMNGTLAATAPGTPGGARSLAGGANYLQVDFFTIPDGTTYLDGTLSLTGTANRNLIISDSIGNYSVQEQGNTTVAPVSKLVFGGVVSGTGGFTKTGFGEARFTANNTLQGDVNVLRFGLSAAPWESHTYKINGVDYATNGLGEGWAEWGVTLNGADGAFNDVANINLQRRGMLTLDNTNRLDPTSGVVGANNNNRIANDAVINMDHGWLRINAGSVANTEALGTINVNSGTNIVDIYGTDGANVNNVLTINTLNRTAGGTIRFTNLDATSTFASAAGANDSAQVALTTLGAGAALSGGAGAANTSTMSIATGVFGGNAPIDLTTDLRVLGFNNSAGSGGNNLTDLWNQQRNIQFATGSHFMTLEGGFLRPLDNDEYFTAPTGVLNPTSLVNTNQNVNLSDVFTIMSQDSTINALRLGALTDHDGTGATGLIDHHGIFLMVDGTLKINSGMISSAYWTVGNTSSATTQIWGGALDMNGQEAIINNQNAYYRLTDGTIQGGDFNIASAITNATGLTKTGFQRVNILGANTYTGLTTVSEGVLDIRNNQGLGVGGLGNGVVVKGAGELRTNSGIRVGTATAREDIYVGILQGDQQIMRVEGDLTQWFSNVTIDNVDASGQAIFTPRVRLDNSATGIYMGDFAGGDTLISNDVLAIDSRVVQFDAAGNNVFILRGVVGDRYVAGAAVPIADPISLLPTLTGTRTNENEVLRVTLNGASLETNFILDRQYNAAGRLTIANGNMFVNYNPAAGGLDGTGFWTTAAISKIPNADSSTTAFNINGSTTQQGFTLTGGGVYLTTPGQVFNMSSWSTSGTAAKFIGGINQSGTVTYGNGTGSLNNTGTTTNLYAADGGTVVFNQRMIGNTGTAPSSFGFVKQGLGNVVLQNTSLAAAADSNFVLAGGTLTLNHTGATVQPLVGNQNARFDGGTLIASASSGANTTASFATNDAADRVLNFSIGGNEIVARTTLGASARNMTINMGNANANGTTPSSNFTRGLGATANLVEDQAAGGTASITLAFNASSTAAVKNQIIPWATYGTLSRTATDFAMADAGAGNDVKAYSRALDEYNNNVATWAAGQDLSENGGSGFSGSLAAPLTVSTLRFDANADSTVNLGTNVLTLASTTLAQSGSALLVSSNVGSANKTITGTGAAALTASGGRVELILHHYGTGNLNVNVPITGAGVDLVIAGPSTTNAATIGTTGAVVLGAQNTYAGQTFINGSVLSFSAANQLGTNATATAIVMNGGTLRYTGTGLTSLGTKGIQFDGNGGTIDITDGAGDLYLDTAILSNATYRGDLIKVGAGTLTLNGTLGAFGSAGNPGFTGLMDIRQGTLRLAVDHGTNTAGNETTEFTTAMGSSTSYMDGTIFRTGTNFAIQMGNANDAGGYSIGEWLTFEGNNYVSVGTINTGTGNTADTAGATELSAPVPNPNIERPINLNGVNTINGTVTFDVVAGQTLRLNNGGTGYTTGNGTLIKDGQGTMVIGTNIPDFTGAITILQGRLYAQGQADNLGTGYTVANGSKVITLGSADRQGIAELAPTSDNVTGATFELNHNVNVVYNPAQSKRLLLETFANGSQIELNGNFTLNDNLQVYINDAAETGGTTNYVNLNGKLLDGATTSGNLVFTSDDTGGANDNTNGRVNNYLVLRNDNSGWTGDVRISTHTSFDQDENAILRLEAGNALGAANDVDMGFNSILQVGGNGSSGIAGATAGNRTIGSLSTNGGTGPFLGGTAGGTMGSTNNGVSAIIENAATTAGTLVINQSTPASTEVVWNVHMRDGTLNSEFFAPGATPVASAALNIVKAGDGWATLQTDNAHTGTTTVNAGILQVGKNGVGDTGATNAAGFTSVLGTVVAGTGTIQGLTSIAGALRPGDEAGSLMGTLMVNGNLTLAATSVSTFQAQRASYTAMNVLGMHDAGYGAWSTTTATDPTYSHLLNDPVTTAQHDKLIATGSLTVTAGGKFVLANNGYNPTAGDIFNVLDWTGGALSLNLGGISYNGGLFRTGAETGTDLDLFELGNGFLYDLSQFNSTGNIIVVQANTRQLYWNGDVDGAWNTNTLGNTNWLDAPAGSDPAGTPAFTDDVHFSATTVGSGGSSTTLGANFTVNTVNFGAGANTTTGATVNTGTNTLTVVNGITQASGSAANTISGTGPGGVVLAQSQTWTNNSANDLTVSAPVSGTANLTKAGTGRLILSGANTYTGTTSVNVGTLRASHGSALGGTLQGTTVASGATLELSGGITVTGEALTLNGTGDGGNGALRNESGNNTFAGNITLASNSTIQSDVPGDVLVLGVAAGSAISGVDASVTFTGDGDTTVAGAISLGTGSLTKDGTGILILEGSNTYTGTTTVSNGVLAINGNNSGATGDVTVGANGILGGNGTVGGNTQVFGSVSTGANPDIFQIGTLNFNGKDVTFNDNSSWFVDLVRDTNNMGDQISNVGAFSIGSNVSLNLVSDLSTFVYGNTYTIATYSSFAGGEFSGFAQGGVLSGYQINYGSNAITLTAVPEPGTLGLLGLALGGFFFRRIRRRRADLALVDSEKSEA